MSAINHSLHIALANDEPRHDAGKRAPMEAKHLLIEHALERARFADKAEDDFVCQNRRDVLLFKRDCFHFVLRTKMKRYICVR